MAREKLRTEEKLWIVWLLTTGISFLILETHAIKKQKHHATLTYTLRKQLGIDPVRKYRIVGTGIVLAASSWFAIHIVTGGLVPRMMQITKEIVTEELEHGVQEVGSQ